MTQQRAIGRFSEGEFRGHLVKCARPILTVTPRYRLTGRTLDQALTALED